MASPQAHERDKLAGVGKEDLDLLDELYPNKHGVRFPPDQACVEVSEQARHQYRLYRGPQVITVMEPIIDSNQAAQFFGAGVVVDHTVRRNIRRAGY